MVCLSLPVLENHYRALAFVPVQTVIGSNWVWKEPAQEPQRHLELRPAELHGLCSEQPSATTSVQQ